MPDAYDRQNNLQHERLDAYAVAVELDGVEIAPAIAAVARGRSRIPSPWWIGSGGIRLLPRRCTISQPLPPEGEVQRWTVKRKADAVHCLDRDSTQRPHQAMDYRMLQQAFLNSQPAA